MEILGTRKLWTFPEGATKSEQVESNSLIRKANPNKVRSFMELATRVADLQFNNREHVLIFRGQSGDYRNKSQQTSIKPTILRASNPVMLPTDAALRGRFAVLRTAEDLLIEKYKSNNWEGLELIQRQTILRWTILQHYEICATPLLDVTQSLRIAASFASINSPKEAFIFVLGVPYISGAITVSADVGLQMVRLASVCPAVAVRPHIQEGYLLGEYPDLWDSNQKANYLHMELDFGRRLIAKFSFDPEEFWESSGSFPMVPKTALYPSEKNDPFAVLAKAIKQELGEL